MSTTTIPNPLCDIRQLGDGTFVGETGNFGMGGLFGGQLAAQALSASIATAPAGWAPQVLHAYFLSPGAEGLPIELAVTPLRDGSRSCHRRVDVTQNGAVIAEVTTILAPDEEIRQQTATPIHAAGPLDSLAGKSIFHRRWNFDQLDIRPVRDPGDGGRYHPVWIRQTHAGTTAVGGEWGLAAFASDLGLVLASMDAHERRTTRAVTTDHSVWFHRRPRLDEWHLLEVKRQARTGRRAIITARITAQSGALVASVAQSVTVLTRRPTQDSVVRC